MRHRLSITKTIITLSTIILTSYTLYSCGVGDNAEVAHHHDGEPATENKESNHNPDEIILEPQIADRMGVVTATVSPSTFSEVLAVTGQLTGSPAATSIASSPTSGSVTLASNIAEGMKVVKGQTIAHIDASVKSGGNADNAAAITLRETKREVDRLAPLHAEGIVSTKEYNAAVKAYEEAKAAYSPRAASGTVTAPTSGVISSLDVRQGQFVDAGAPVAVITSGSQLVLRADVPQRDARAVATVTDANFKVAYGDKWLNVASLGGHRSSPDLSGESNYVPVYFTFDNPGDLIAGAFAEVRLIGKDREGVLIVPATAISEQQGDLFVYVRTGDHSYEKRRVECGTDNGSSVEILSGLTPGQEVVTEGVTAIRLAETSGNVPEGHSHSH